MPKVKQESKTKQLRHNPLAEQIIEAEESQGLRKTPRNKFRRKKGVAGGDDEEGDSVLPAEMTKKVLEVAQAQKASDELGFADEDEPDFTGSARGGGSTLGGSIAGELEMEDVEVDDDGFVVTQGLSEEEERALSMFLPGGQGAPKAGPTLADIILQKIQEHDTKSVAKEQRAAREEAQALSPKVIQVYSEIGKWLKHYKSGKVPKAFKVIPSLTNWEEVLALTNPLSWSPAAMYEAVAIFASNLNPRMAQRFFNLVLLPAVRQNIAEHKRLNFHYYRSLKKALFKPAAFFKGIVLPLAAENCTLREVCVLSSILGKASVPAMHAAATVVRLCVLTPWYGTTSILLATLLNKKYALPVQVIEHLVAHFCAFSADERVLPVVWHRALLIFVQRYKFDLNPDQRKRLRELLKIHFHDAIGAEVRRELLAPKPGEIQEVSAATAQMEIG